MNPRFLCVSLFALSASTVSCLAQGAAPAKPPIVNDSALKIELVAGYPDVEACTTVCGAPDGSFYVGNDPRDGRLSTSQPVNTIIRFSGFGADRKRTVFADKIYSPAGSVWHDGWLYILHDPLLTRFKDTNGDGVADVREDLVTNLGIPPNEGLNDHVVSGFTLGMDGFFYISVGDRGIFQAKSAKDGSMITMQGGGIARCRTDGTQLEVFSTGTRNHLQVNLDAEDNAFTRDNTDDGNGWWTRLTHHVEGGYYGYPFDYQAATRYGVIQPSQQTLDAIQRQGMRAARGEPLSGPAPKPEPGAPVPAPDANGLPAHRPADDTFLPAMADFGGGSPTGGLCYLSDGLPEQYRGKHFFSEWGKAGVYVTEVAREGATYKLVSDTKLVEPEKGGDFRPMQLSVAADGSLLIADWGYGGWKSPRTAGAVWRLSWPEAKPLPRLQAGKASVSELITALNHPDRDQRLLAQEALSAKGNAALAAIIEQMHNEKAPVQARVHALWAMSRLAGDAPVPQPGDRSEGLIRQMLADSNPVLRAQAARALGRRQANSATEDLVKLLGDESAFVRRTALEALGHMRGGDLKVMNPIVLALGDRDGWVRSAADAAIRSRLWDMRTRWSGGGISLHMVDAVKEGLKNPDAQIRNRIWDSLENVLKSRTVIRLDVANYYGEPKVREELLADTGENVLEVVIPATKSAEPAERIHAVKALGSLAYLGTLYDGHWWGTQPAKTLPPPDVVAWKGTEKVLATLSTVLGDSDAKVRLAAAKAFTGFLLGDTGKEAGAALRTRLTAETEPAVRRQLIESVGVQKDPLAMDVFRQIAMDEKADTEFRETAISAVVNIGGDAAKQTIAQLATATLSPAATRKIIVAAGDLKVLEVAPSLIARLKDADAANREAAAKALQQLGAKSNAGPALVEALADKDSKVLIAVIDALGSLREKSALPALIAFAEKKKFPKETIGALSNMPDESAIPVLVETLRDKNTGVRRNAIKALKTMREKAWPQVEALLASGRVPEELVPEIRNAFESGAITRWKMIGVFENVWDAVHPPEKDSLANGGMPNLTAKYHNAEGKDVGWIDVTADGDVGRVDLERTFKSSAMVCAYAFTEIEAPQAADAKLFTSADDEICVWLNGQQVLNQPGNHGYEPDKNETPLQLKAGKNLLFVKIGNKGGSWVFHARMPGLDNGKFIKAQGPTPEEKQKLFALAAKPDGSFANAGNAKNGEKLFFDQAAALGGICATCHTVGNKGGQIGPALTTVGANYKRADLISSILEPSKTIALGFEQVMLETNGGDTVAGSLRAESADGYTIVDAAGQSKTVKKSEVKKKTDLHTSLMPPGLTLGLRPEDFVDLLAFLESLKG